MTLRVLVHPWRAERRHPPHSSTFTWHSQVFSLSGSSFGNTVLPVKTISFKVSEEEARGIRQQASRERLTLSEFLRRRALGSAQGRSIRKSRCKHTGAEIFAPLPGDPPLTTEAVREMLSDFP